jgi:hypothetical protein
MAQVFKRYHNTVARATIGGGLLALMALIFGGSSYHALALVDPSGGAA